MISAVDEAGAVVEEDWVSNAKLLVEAAVEGKLLGTIGVGGSLWAYWCTK